MLLPFVMALTLTTMAHCDAVGRGIHAINRVAQRSNAVLATKIVHDDPDKECCLRVPA
jgi:hypothetical protein